MKVSLKYLTLHTLLRLGDLWERKGKPRKKSYFSFSYSFFSKYTAHYVLRQLQTKNYFRIKFPVNQLKESPGIKLTANYHIKTTSHFDANRFWCIIILFSTCFILEIKQNKRVKVTSFIKSVSLRLREMYYLLLNF